MFLFFRKLAEYQKNNIDGRINPEKYVTNPLSSFSLIRRLASDWRDLYQYLLNDPGTEILMKIQQIREDENFPIIDDIQSVVTGFLRLQSTYKLDPMEAINGKINGVQYR